MNYEDLTPATTLLGGDFQKPPPTCRKTAERGLVHPAVSADLRPPSPSGMLRLPVCCMERRHWRQKTVTRITVELDDMKAAALRERAGRYGLTPDQLVTASIEDLLAHPEPEFESAMRRVLSSNKKLYERLA